jgi:hypothetical protein
MTSEVLGQPGPSLEHGIQTRMYLTGAGPRHDRSQHFVGGSGNPLVNGIPHVPHNQPCGISLSPSIVFPLVLRPLFR